MEDTRTYDRERGKEGGKGREGGKAERGRER